MLVFSISDLITGFPCKFRGQIRKALIGKQIHGNSWDGLGRTGHLSRATVSYTPHKSDVYRVAYRHHIERNILQVTFKDSNKPCKGA